MAADDPFPPSPHAGVLAWPSREWREAPDPWEMGSGGRASPWSRRRPGGKVHGPHPGAGRQGSGQDVITGCGSNCVLPSGLQPGGGQGTHGSHQSLRTGPCGQLSGQVYKLKASTC